MAVMPLRTRRDTQLLAMFVDSGRNVLHAAVLLRELLAQWPDGTRLLGEIVDAEHAGDRIAHDILHRLAERGSPLDAADVHALACALDDIIDHAEEAADRLSLYRVEAATDQAVEIAEVLVLAAAEVAAALEGRRRRRSVGAAIEVHRLENEADRIVRGAVATLFADGIDPMAVIRWKDIFETLEAAVDACESVANVLEGMCLKRGRPSGSRRTAGMFTNGERRSGNSRRLMKSPACTRKTRRTGHPCPATSWTSRSRRPTGPAAS